MKKQLKNGVNMMKLNNQVLLLLLSRITISFKIEISGIQKIRLSSGMIEYGWEMLMFKCIEYSKSRSIWKLLWDYMILSKSITGKSMVIME